MISYWAQPEWVCIEHGKIRTLMGCLPGYNRGFRDKFVREKPVKTRSYKYSLVDETDGSMRHFYTQKEIQELLGFADPSGVYSAYTKGYRMRKRYRVIDYEEDT